MVFRVKSFLLFPLAMLLVACATIVDGGKETVTIESVPSGAMVYKHGIKESMGKTPLQLTLNRKDRGPFILKKEGYRTQLMTINPAVNRKTHLNVAALPVYGIASTIDEFSGAGYKFEKNHIIVELLKNGGDANRKRKCDGCRLFPLFS